MTFLKGIPVVAIMISLRPCHMNQTWDILDLRLENLKKKKKKKNPKQNQTNKQTNKQTKTKQNIDAISLPNYTISSSHLYLYSFDVTKAKTMPDGSMYAKGCYRDVREAPEETKIKVCLGTN